MAKEATQKKSSVSAETIAATRLAGGKRNAEVQKGIDANKAYSVDEAVRLISRAPRPSSTRRSRSP